MPNLSDLTPAEILEAAQADPRIAVAIANQDPRVKLMDRLYGDPEGRKDIQKHSKRLFPTASIPEVDVPDIARKAIEEDAKAIKDLRSELESDKKNRAHAAFRSQLVEAGAESADLDAIETFMVENEIGPKSVQLAVDKFYETKETAEPNGERFSWNIPGEDKEHHDALWNAPPGADLDVINMPHVERIWNETFGGTGSRRRRPAGV